MLFNRTAHIELWMWLLENFPAEKRDWPGWKNNGGQYRDGTECHCFACDYAEEVRVSEDVGMNKVCTFCPLMPEGNISAMRFYIPECLEGLYEKYEQCVDCKGEARELSDEERHARGKGLARMIANLPVRDEVCCE